MIEIVTEPAVVISSGTLILIVAKWYHDHMTLKEIKESEKERELRLDDIEKENIKIIEALERTYVSKDYVFKYFIGREDFEKQLSHLEDNLTLKMQNINDSVKSLVDSLKKEK